MTSQQAEIKACLCQALQDLTDASLAAAGFKRRKNSVVYSRKAGEAIQKIDVVLEHHPIDRETAAAAVYPFYTVVLTEVNDLVRAMVCGDSGLGGDFAVTLRGPIEWTAPKGVGARWYVFQADSVPGVASALREFAEQWTIPFLDKYTTTADLCDATLEGDNRVIHIQPDVLRVVAAKVLCGQSAQASELMERCFGKPGPRRQYQHVFQYLQKRVG